VVYWTEATNVTKKSRKYSKTKELNYNLEQLSLAIKGLMVVLVQLSKCLRK
jgi:hypothetical protein